MGLTVGPGCGGARVSNGVGAVVGMENWNVEDILRRNKTVSGLGEWGHFGLRDFAAFAGRVGGLAGNLK